MTTKQKYCTCRRGPFIDGFFVVIVVLTFVYCVVANWNRRLTIENLPPTPTKACP